MTTTPGTPLVIITGHVVVAPTARDAYVERMQPLVTRARAADGCVHLAITADPIDGRRVNTTEVWRDEEALLDWRETVEPPEQPPYEDVAVGFYRAREVDPV